jgi:mannitol/fructose-specific phosphotransferase system IIA component (Ntr-type)/galactitol-specific phosphotransferase system IIB component
MERINTYHKVKKNVLIVCGAGIGTAKLISAKIQSIFDVNIVGTVAYRQMNTILKQEEVDLIVSTFQVNVAGITSIKVEPILTDTDIRLLNNYLMRLKETKISENKMIKVIKKYCVINDIDNLKKDLSNLFNNNDNNFTKGVVPPMLKDLLTDKSIKLNVDAKDWEDCVRKGGALLEQNGCIESRYTDAMVDSVKEIGPYIVIAPGIAMPHARPEAGSKKIGMSLLTLKHPIKFGNKDNDPVRIVVCLCAIDSSTHLKAMSELVVLLGDDEKIEKINVAENVSDILCLLEDEK